MNWEMGREARYWVLLEKEKTQDQFSFSVCLELRTHFRTHSYYVQWVEEYVSGLLGADQAYEKLDQYGMHWGNWPKAVTPSPFRDRQLHYHQLHAEECSQASPSLHLDHQIHQGIR